jgi:hypothetical protein
MQNPECLEKFIKGGIRCPCVQPRARRESQAVLGMWEPVEQEDRHLELKTATVRLWARLAVRHGTQPFQQGTATLKRPQAGLSARRGAWHNARALGREHPLSCLRRPISFQHRVRSGTVARRGLRTNSRSTTKGSRIHSWLQAEAAKHGSPDGCEIG